MKMGAVNAALREAVLEDQRRYARAALLLEAQMPQLVRSGYPFPGRFETWTNGSLISASTVVVSALIPALELYPGGNDRDRWISVTVRVPSGERVGIGDLFAEPQKGLAALAAAARRKLTSADRCVRRSLKNEQAFGVPVAQGFAASPENYRHFALTTRGLVIGFPIGQVGGSSCGRVRVTLGYDVVRPYLSELGQSLIAGVRSPSAVKRGASYSTEVARPPSGLTRMGRALWEFEALLRDRFGRLRVSAHYTFGVSWNFVACRIGCAPLSYWSFYAYTFQEARHSGFHVSRRRSLPVFGNYPVPIKLKGRFVACDGRERTFLISYASAAGFAFDCLSIR